MKKAIKFLDEFRAEHHNKLPSLRAIMKMMKVGFPKAHDILNSYALHVQIPKHVLMQDMVVRQERAKEDEAPPNGRSKSKGSRRNVGILGNGYSRHGLNGGSHGSMKSITDSDEESVRHLNNKLFPLFLCNDSRPEKRKTKKTVKKRKKDRKNKTKLQKIGNNFNQLPQKRFKFRPKQKIIVNCTLFSYLNWCD